MCVLLLNLPLMITHFLCSCHLSAGDSIATHLPLLLSCLHSTLLETAPTVTHTAYTHAHNATLYSWSTGIHTLYNSTLSSTICHFTGQATDSTHGSTHVSSGLVGLVREGMGLVGDEGTSGRILQHDVAYLAHTQCQRIW